MRSSRIPWILVASSLLALGSCHEDVRGRPPIAKSATVAAPPSLLAVATLPSPNKDFERIRSFASAVHPLAGITLGSRFSPKALLELVELGSAEGIDFDRPLRLLLLDPRAQPHPLVLLAPLGDEKAFWRAVGTKGPVGIRIDKGHVAIGAKGALEAVAPYAFALVEEAAPKHPIVRVDVGNVMRLYRKDLEAARKGLAPLIAAQSTNDSFAKIIDLYFDIANALGDQTQAATISLEIDAGAASLDFALVPRHGTELAEFTRVQAPTDYALVGRLPSFSGIVIGARLTLGPYRERTVDLMRIFLPGSPPDLEKTLLEIMDLASGEMAAAMRPNPGLKGFQLAELFGVSDGARAMELTDQWLSTLSRSAPQDLLATGMKWSVRWNASAFSHDGVVVGEQANVFDLTAVPPEQRATFEATQDPDARTYVGASETTLVLAMGHDRQIMKEALDAAHRKRSATPGAGLAAALEDSRARRESALAFIDLRELVAAFRPGSPPRSGPPASGMVMAMGFADGATHFRMAIGADHARELVEVFTGRP